MYVNTHERFGKIIIIAGMQYGSEGKGAITSYLAPVVSVGVRTGAANAGHTIYFRGKRYVMHQLPSTWINPRSKLVVGAGSVISLDILLNEIRVIDQILPIKKRLYIDRNASVVTSENIMEERRSTLGSRIASTSAQSDLGIGAAMAHKVTRHQNCLQAKHIPSLQPYLIDTTDLLNSELDHDQIVLLEGTQGFGLSLEHGNFPFVTSRDTGATAIAASAGICTHLFDVGVIGVVRTYPIRVAGTSGPFGTDSREVDWNYVSKMSGASKSHVTLSERTSVTKKIRRVATFSLQDFRKAVQVNRPTQIAVTFADYLDWSIHECGDISRKVETFIEILEREARGALVTLVKTGPTATIDFESYRRSIIHKLTS